MKKFLLLIAFLVSTPQVFAFCGFYVAKADTKIFNQASQVVIVRDESKTVMTMANDFQGDLKEFAIVIPVPTVITRKQIHIGDKKIIDHLDAYSAPRLVEYFDENPCQMRRMEDMAMSAPQAAVGRSVANERAKSLGITIEAQYTVGEYDIVILSATQSGGLQTWLVENGYKMPRGADRILGSYIKQNMKFFLARVNLKEQQKLGFSYLRPLQVAYEHRKFMLPIRLGTLNANGPQELFVYTLTRKGRVETTNYRTVRLPSDVDIPIFVKTDFAPFYKAMFRNQVDKEDMSVVFLEYAWNMAWCDPCAADPLSPQELKQLGVFWLDQPNDVAMRMPGGPVNVFLTRLHVRYDEAHFPEDLMFQETGDQSNFQARYVLRHPWTGKDSCPAAREYRAQLRKRQEREVQNLARLTGWEVDDIRQKANFASFDEDEDPDQKWWERIWED
jgi:hypothetical protein